MSHIKETGAGQVGPVKHLQTSLNGLERKAAYDKEHRFENLYGLLNQWNLGEAWRHVNKSAASGIDKVGASEFEERLTEEVKLLETELKNNAYKSNLIRRVYIDKANGGKRPLGIPTVRDKLLQTLCSKILEAIYEPKFYDTRYGYRKDKGAKSAMKRLATELNFGKYGWVVEADIKGYFQNIDHDILMKMLEHDIKDKRFLHLIEKWLKAGIMTEENIVQRPDAGTPQGGTVSPILANVYLHYILDMWFEEVVKKQLDGESMMIAYADDFVCAFRYHRDAERFMKALRKRFAKFGLELAEDKTNKIRFSRFNKERNGDFDFLGFTYRWETSWRGKDFIKTTTAKKKFIASARKFKDWIKNNRHKRIRKIIDQLNVKLRGYYNYYGVRCNFDKLEEMLAIVKKLLFKWLNRRSQKRSFNWEEFTAKLKRNYPLMKPYVESGNEQIRFVI